MIFLLPVWQLFPQENLHCILYIPKVEITELLTCEISVGCKHTCKLLNTEKRHLINLSFVMSLDYLSIETSIFQSFP